MANVVDYVKYYEDILSVDQCKEVLHCTETVFVASSYSNKDGEIVSNERVRMDEFWVKKDSVLYPLVHGGFSRVIKKYSEEFERFSVQHTTDFRINRYVEGGFMSSHVDNIHHSHGQQYGYPQVSALLYLNDDYEGGEFYVADKKFEPKQGSAIIFPSNFMFPHEAKEVTKGTRWSIVTWLM